ncbi:MAG: hypothetical protein QXQ94_09150 [Candidatus Bathyarchaeia archaeon]
MSRLGESENTYRRQSPKLKARRWLMSLGTASSRDGLQSGRGQPAEYGKPKHEEFQEIVRRRLPGNRNCDCGIQRVVNKRAACA